MLDIKATKSTPRIIFIEDSDTLEMSGESYPENSFAFFAPVFDWLHSEIPKLETLQFNVSVNYMNSSSTKCMLDILDLLNEAFEQGKKVSITWFYQAGNDRARDLAEEFKEDLSIPFMIQPFEKEEVTE